MSLAPAPRAGPRSIQEAPPLEQDLAPAPRPQQLAWQQWRLGMFCHFGINTFFGAEWSDGTLPASSFDPRELDADQWVRTAAEIGARYVVLTAKHHDGFCLWPTATTAYSVASSPWRDGRGDVVAEVADACRRHGLGLGVYLSPWDRNAACYPDPAAYDDFYVAQLTELCTRYGPLVEVWFDGAGSQGRTYDWARIIGVVREHQGDAVVFNLGDPDIRWVGNEDGLAHDPVEYAVAATALEAYGDAATDLGELRYVPPECDVSLRRGWFWSADDRPKPLEHLIGIYYNSIGLGANLLLNVPPDRRGLICDADLARLGQWRKELDRRFHRPVRARLEQLGTYEWGVVLPGQPRFDHVVLHEDYRAGQQVRRHAVTLADGTPIAAGLTVGGQRIHVTDPHQATELRIHLEGAAPVLAAVEVYDTEGASAGEIGYLADRERPDIVTMS